ncbi:MAG: putative Zn-dependent hydrolase [Candidatus Saccharibacteria bacterium]|nr:putative Zn-dependent hydrolase [Candidatus Saccharibacteria bacterium]
MQLTKYEHACFTVEKDEQILVVDPGEFSSDFLAPENVKGIVITHAHPDHLDREKLTAIIDKNPEAIIIGPEEIVSHIEVFETKAVAAGDLIEIGPFRLEFFGGEHAIIHPSLPAIANLGVLINDLLYYPGDSFTVPNKSVDTVALPIAAPWLKISEVMDFLTTIHPRLAFPTHDAILSDVGKEIIDGRLQDTASKADILYQRISSPINI